MPLAFTLSGVKSSKALFFVSFWDDVKDVNENLGREGRVIIRGMLKLYERGKVFHLKKITGFRLKADSSAFYFIIIKFRAYFDRWF